MTTPFNIPFSDPQTSESGRPFRTGAPTREFWEAWRTGKDGLKEQGFRVRKVNTTYLVDYTPSDEPDAPTYPGPNPILPLRNSKLLLKYQIPHVAQITAALRRYGSALDASDTGTGKTYSALAVARETGLIPAIVCPKSVIPAWERVAKTFGIQPYFVMNWEGCKSKKFTHGVLDFRTDDYFWKLGKTKILLIFDEAHKGKAEYSQNAKMIIAAKRQALPCLLLSATIGSSPRDMRAMGYMLGLHSLSDFRGWSQALGCYQQTWAGGGTSWACSDPAVAMTEVHKYLFPAKGARIRIADLGDAFPDTQITADLYPIAKTRQQNQAYEELLQAIAKLKAEKKAGWNAAAMTLNLRYRQQAESLKVEVLTSLARDYLEDGHSVALFVNFTATLHEILDAFPDAVAIHGQQTGEERQSAIDSFQSDKARVIVAQIMAGGVGVSLHDLHGRHSRVALLCPTYSAKDLKQALGRVHRAGGKTKSLQRVIYAAGTIEEDVCKKVAKRLDALATLNDGDLAEKDILQILGNKE